jgi:polyvinyl alcohol dehydrogenase (cytochrome)
MGLVILCASALFAQDGATVYKTQCAACHDAPVGRVPPAATLREMSARAILSALDDGVMKTQAAGLTEAQRQAVARYLGKGETSATKMGADVCSAAAPAKSGSSARWAAWGANVANTRFQSAAAAGLPAEEVPNLKLKWAFGLGGGTTARSQPAVARGRVFVGSEAGNVYALDAKSGCTYWTFHAEGRVRSGIVFGLLNSSKQPAVFFGDQKANVYAVSADTGRLLWKAHPDDQFAAIITAAPQFHKGVLYVGVSSFEEGVAASPKYKCCQFRGSVVALNAKTGSRIWQAYTIATPPETTKTTKAGPAAFGPSGAAVWSTPTFDEKRDRIYVATGDNYSNPPTATSDAVLAFDAKSGKLLWSQQATSGDMYNVGCGTPAKTNCPEPAGGDFDFGEPPMLVSLPNGHRALVIGQKSGQVHAFDPEDHGKPLWTKRVGQGGALGGIQWGSAADSDRVYVAVSDIRIHVAPDSAAPQGYRLVLDPEHGGGLFALSAATGEIVWSAKPFPCGDRKNCSPAQSAPVSAIPGVVFSGSVDGHLRGYAAATGRVICDLNTAREYDTVNGQKARGGSLDVAGPVIAGGMLYVTSGCGQWGGMPGNVLLAYSVGGR